MLKKKRRSNTWKTTERQSAALFGGRRVPLSGSNSGHKTSADVMDVPKWLYVECKRRQMHNTFWLQKLKGKGVTLIEYLREGNVVTADCDPFRLYFFRVDLFMKEWGQHINVSDCEYKFKKTARPITQYGIEYLKAKREGRDATILIYRVHGRLGLYAIADNYTVERLEEWVNKYGRPMLDKNRHIGVPKKSSNGGDPGISFTN